jgi:hypothetical protein
METEKGHSMACCSGLDHRKVSDLKHTRTTERVADEKQRRRGWRGRGRGLMSNPPPTIHSPGYTKESTVAVRGDALVCADPEYHASHILPL